MIRYALACDHGHEFEGWFGSSVEFDRQQRTGLLECPTCGTSSVSKGLMAPAVSTSRQRAARSERAVEVAASAPTSQEVVNLSTLPDPKRKIVEEMRKLRDKMLKGSEDVGPRFGEEARKIHYGEAEARSIHGQASMREAKDLADEGVEFLPLPDLPDDRN